MKKLLGLKLTYWFLLGYCLLCLLLGVLFRYLTESRFDLLLFWTVSSLCLGLGALYHTSYEVEKLKKELISEMKKQK